MLHSMFVVLLTFTQFNKEVFGDQLRLSPAPFAVVTENDNLTLTCKYNGTDTILAILWRAYQDYSEYIQLNTSCIPMHSSEAFTQHKTFACNESTGEFQMTIINIQRDRHGQPWFCELNFNNFNYKYSENTMIDVRGDFPVTTCFMNPGADICPYPIAKVEANQTLSVTVKVKKSSPSMHISWNEHKNSSNYIENSFGTDAHCTRLGPMPAGYNISCSPTESTITFTIDHVEMYRNGQMWRIYIVFDDHCYCASDTIMIFYFISVEANSSMTSTSGVSATTTNSTSTITDLISPTLTTTVATESRDNTTGTTNSDITITPLNNISGSHKADSDKFDLGLELTLKVEMEYKQAYGNKTSEEFKCLSTNFSIALSETFRSMCGFKWIEILNFQSNPVIVNFTIHAFPDLDINHFIEATTRTVAELKHIAGVPVDTAYAQSSVNSTLENLRSKDKCDIASENVCPFGYYCKQASTTILLCIDRCNSSFCENNGECYISHHSNDIHCRCPISDGVVFTGKRCETKQLIVTIHERNLYLIILGSVIGAIITIFVITVCVSDWKRRNLKSNLASFRNLRVNEIVKMDENNILAVSSMTSYIPRLQENADNRMGHLTEGGITEVLDGDYFKLHNGTRGGVESAYDYLD